MKNGVSKTLRVMLLTDKDLVPDRPRSKLSGRQAELRKTEYDVLNALKRVGHDVRCTGIGSNLGVLRRALKRDKPHIVFNLVEEFDGYALFDQHVVSYLELCKQKYTGCNPRGLTIARDKALTKKILVYHRVPVARFAVFKPRRSIKVPTRLRFPLFVKSLTEEGSEGISQASLVTNAEKLVERIAFIHEKTNSPALVEEFVEGREISVGVFGNEVLTVLPAWELKMVRRPKDAPLIATDRLKWDPAYQRKVGLRMGPARLPEDQAKRLAQMSKRIYKVLHLSGYARLDYRVRKDGRAFLLEANPNPQISRKEDFSDPAAHAGISYEELLQKLITLGLSYQPGSS